MVNRGGHGVYDDSNVGLVVEDIIPTSELFQVVNNSNCVESVMSIQIVTPIIIHLSFPKAEVGPNQRCVEASIDT